MLVTSKININQGAQARFVRRLYALMKLIIPRNPICGGKRVNGREAHKSIPVEV